MSGVLHRAARREIERESGVTKRDIMRDKAGVTKGERQGARQRERGVVFSHVLHGLVVFVRHWGVVINALLECPRRDDSHVGTATAGNRLHISAQKARCGFLCNLRYLCLTLHPEVRRRRMAACGVVRPGDHGGVCRPLGLGGTLGDLFRWGGLESYSTGRRGLPDSCNTRFRRSDGGTTFF